MGALAGFVGCRRGAETSLDVVQGVEKFAFGRLRRTDDGQFDFEGRGPEIPPNEPLKVEGSRRGKGRELATTAPVADCEAGVVLKPGHEFRRHVED